MENSLSAPSPQNTFNSFEDETEEKRESNVDENEAFNSFEDETYEVERRTLEGHNPAFNSFEDETVT